MTDLSKLTAALAGRYDVDREVGEGGMATVYLARDLRHDRRVALKVLKPELGAVLGVERFLAEIKVTANLQHPNLLPLFDSGETEGLLYYVMPFVEGESLRARLDREKQLPVDEAVRIGAAVASALDYAHRQGVIHRDLKPENILLHEGQPLVADFGIALAVSNAGGGRITQTGLSLGTPQYMSPEQATGDRAVDGRTDIYSLGAVTYEMLTGDAPHTGSTSQAIIARVLTEKPRRIRSSRPNVPVHVEATVERALEKLPADRFATAKGFADGLTGVVAVASLTASDAANDTPRAGRERSLMFALGAVVVMWAATAAYMARRGVTEPDAPAIRFEVSTPQTPGAPQVELSPDGRVVAFFANVADGGRGIFARPLGSTEAKLVSGTEGGAHPFWSFDSREIVFDVDQKLKRAAIEGGPATTICEFASGQLRGGTWNADNVILFSNGADVYRVASVGGVPAKVPLSYNGASQWMHPWFLPDGKHFLVLAHQGTVDVRGVFIASIEGGAPTRIGPADSRVAFAPPDRLLFVRDEVLYTQAFDPRALRTTGEPVPVVEGVGANPTSGVSGFGVSKVGSLVYRPGSARLVRQLRWYSRDGKPGAAVGAVGAVIEFAVSPDEARVAVSMSPRSGALPEVSTVDLGSNITSRLVADTNVGSGVLWSRDSRSVTFYRGAGIYTRRVGGVTDSLVVRSDSVVQTNRFEEYSPDGQMLLIHRLDTVFAVPLSSGQRPRFLGAIKRVSQVRFSPDGQRVSYVTDESGRPEVWVAWYPSLNDRRQVSASGGVQPRWRADGKELYFLELGGRVMVAAVRPGRPTEFLAPSLLFQSPSLAFVPSRITNEYDVSRDGQRFLFAVAPDLAERGLSPLVVVVNWTNALKKK